LNAMAQLQLSGISKRYGDFYAAREIDLNVKDGEFVVLLGPSGCGKTTTLRMIAGFVDPTSGSVRIGDRDVTHIPAWSRNTGLVFQNYALFPHLTVAQNVAFGLEMRRTPKAEIPAKVEGALRLVRLGHLGERLPSKLSGGQQQRVAVIRAVAARPALVLADEPTANLDSAASDDLLDIMLELNRELGVTFVFATHDTRVMERSRRLIRMVDGAIVSDEKRS
jgi:putative spermidine/putrescine transport system ATP-binding protein